MSTKHRYRIIKPAEAANESVDCTGCKWLKYSFNSKVAPCRLCAGARLDSESDYHTGRAAK